MTTPTTNRELLEHYIGNECFDYMTIHQVRAMLREIQCRLMSPVQVPDEVSSAITLLEATGEYIITKK